MWEQLAQVVLLSNEFVFVHEVYVIANGLNKWGWWDEIAYSKNRAEIDPEQLREYLGEWLGWNLDGTKCIALHEEGQEVVRLVREMGLDTDRAVREHLVSLYADD